MEDQKQAIVHQIFGPPGTGKTHYLTHKVREIVRQHGPESVLIVSFTVTAAQEIGSRDIGLPPRSVGTLHSLAFRAIGHEHPVALDPDILKSWNESAPYGWRLTADTRRGKPQSATESGGQNTDATTASNGDELLASLDRARGVYTDPADYPPELADFARAWEKWKDEAGAVDFSDMIMMALQQARDGESAPGNPMVLIVDEGQDMTPLETDLALEWGKKAASLVIALDDDQAIMEWRGGDPRRMLELGNDDGFIVDRHVLGKSYRVPAAVHAVAERWVRRLSVRQEKRYDPRTVFEPMLDDAGDPLFDADGTPMTRDTGRIVPGAAFCVPESLENLQLIDRIEEEVERGRSVMLIASCAYMLESLIKGLRAVGMPFHNPFRPAEPRWNPLGARTGTPTAERVYRYLVSHESLGAKGRLWTGDDIRAWIDLVRARDSGLKYGAKSQADKLPKGEVAWEDVAALFADEEALTRAVTPDLEWFAENIVPSKTRAAAYPIQVARKRGPGALSKPPSVVLGTIHSVKGGAADVVYVSPDLSSAGIAQVSDPNGRDQTIRLFYVAMTRAREELRLLAPASRNHISRRDLLPSDLEVPA